MGFFDGLLNTVSGAASGGGLIGAIGDVAGGLLGLGGNSNASGVDAATLKQELDAIEKSKDQGISYLDQGKAEAQGYLAPEVSQTPIMLPQNRGLTTQQQLGEQDLIRNGETELAASGLRGAGRAGVGALMDSISRYEAGARGGNDAANLSAMQTNRQNQNTARGALATLSSNTGTAKANTEIGAGSQTVGALGTIGQQQAGLAQQAGNLAGNTATSAASTLGSTLGSMAGFNIGGDPNLGAPFGVSTQQQPAQQNQGV